jgi:hypothetical protein
MLRLGKYYKEHVVREYLTDFAIKSIYKENALIDFYININCHPFEIDVESLKLTLDTAKKVFNIESDLKRLCVLYGDGISDFEKFLVLYSDLLYLFCETFNMNKKKWKSFKEKNNFEIILDDRLIMIIILEKLKIPHKFKIIDIEKEIVSKILKLEFNKKYLIDQYNIYIKNYFY